MLEAKKLQVNGILALRENLKKIFLFIKLLQHFSY